MASTIDNKMTWMSKISYENVTKIESFQIYLKNDYANDVNKIVCDYIHNIIIKLFYNDSKITIKISSNIRNYDMYGTDFN